VPQIIHSTTSLASAFPQGFKRYVQADFIAVFETVGNRLGRGIDSHCHTFDLMQFYSIQKGIS
jgi:hypothetical protein